MIATSGNNTGGTADIYISTEESTSETYTKEVTAEEIIDAVGDFVRAVDQLIIFEPYPKPRWPENIIRDIKPQIRGNVLFGFFSGFMSEARGEHWDNKSRRGIK